VAANCPILRPELDALSCRFHRRAAGEIFEWVVTKQRQISNFGAGRQSRGSMASPRDDSLGHDSIHIRSQGGFQRRLAAKRFLRLIGSAVRNDNTVLHELSQSKIMNRGSASSLCNVGWFSKWSVAVVLWSVVQPYM